MLCDEIAALYDQFNEDKELIKSVVYAKNYYYELPGIGLHAA
ncbi:hypothetical protein [Thermotalea metallivorans]|nr:hypothetical protein [Thermotalea metallivorans]